MPEPIANRGPGEVAAAGRGPIDRFGVLRYAGAGFCRSGGSQMAGHMVRSSCGPVWDGDVMTEFALTLPAEEAAHVRKAYAAAQVILEYGAGGSTLLAAEMPGKLVFSVESDWHWARRLQEHIDLADLPSPAIVYHVDIGPTGRWGRPVDDSKWQNYHHYPLKIWSEPFFRDPDLILIDGRLRPACLVAASLRARRPMTVLFDDYADRPAYHIVERLLSPVRMIGRMAEFRIEPQVWPVWAQDLLVDLCAQRSLAGQAIG